MLEFHNAQILGNGEYGCTLGIVTEQLTRVANDQQSRIGIEDLQQVVCIGNDGPYWGTLRRNGGNLTSDQLDLSTNREDVRAFCCEGDGHSSTSRYSSRSSPRGCASHLPDRGGNPHPMMTIRVARDQTPKLTKCHDRNRHRRPHAHVCQICMSAHVPS